MTTIDAPAPGELLADQGEERRLAALARLELVAGVPDANFEAMTRVAAYVCGTSNAAINIVEADHQWTAAGYPCSIPDTPRSDTLCGTSIGNPDVSYTSDATHDARWADNPFVTGVIDSIRTYAAAPLVLPSGDIIGTVCVFDRARAPVAPRSTRAAARRRRPGRVDAPTAGRRQQPRPRRQP